MVAFNKCDLAEPEAGLIARLDRERIPYMRTVARHGAGLQELRTTILRAAPPEHLRETPILADLVGAGEMAVLVVPIDKEAPKGRLIQPQVQAIRDLLDGDAYCLVVKERELRAALDRLKTPPKLVVTDSQAFLKWRPTRRPVFRLPAFRFSFPGSRATW